MQQQNSLNYTFRNSKYVNMLWGDGVRGRNNGNTVFKSQKISGILIIQINQNVQGSFKAYIYTLQ